jgi:hypothetical protein
MDIQSSVLKGLGQLDSSLSKLLSNVYVSTSLKVFLALYAVYAGSAMPAGVAQLFNYTLVRVLFAFLIVFLAIKDPGLSLMIAIAFVVSLQAASYYNLIDTSMASSVPGSTSWLPSAKNLPGVPTPNFANMIAPETSSPENVPVLPYHSNVSAQDVAMMRNSMPSKNLTIGGFVMEGMDTTVPAVEAPFTTQSQFIDSQNNIVPGSDPNSCIQTWQNENCIQGIQLNVPTGASDDMDKYSSF